MINFILRRFIFYRLYKVHEVRCPSEVDVRQVDVRSEQVRKRLSV